MDDSLSTEQAADLLHVSPAYVLGLIERGVLVPDASGRWSRADLLAFRERFDLERKAALDRLAELSQEAGLYNDDVDETDRPSMADNMNRWARAEDGTRTIHGARVENPTPEAERIEQLKSLPNTEINPDVPRRKRPNPP